MSDERMWSLLDTWLRERDEAARDSTGDIARVMADVPRTRQQGRWWPLPTLDRPVSAFPSRGLAPVPIPATDGRQPARGFTMFSALKFMVASVIVALFGGLLTLGVFTMQQSEEVPPAAVSASPTVVATSEPTEAATTSVRTDILPGVDLTVEEVEPGVFHVFNDGVRDLVLVGDTDIVAGHDGSIWLVRDVPGGPVSPISRLGSDSSFQLPKGWDTRIVVAPDGAVWVSRTRGRPENREVNRIHSLADGKWTLRLKGPAFGGQHGLAVGPDGTIWTTRPATGEKEGVVVTRLGPDGWQRLKGRAPFNGDPVVTDSGEVWLVGHVGRMLVPDDDGAWQEVGRNSLWRYREDAGGWEEVTIDAVTVTPFGNPVEVGPDGTVWFAGVEPLMVDGQPVPDGEWSAEPGDAYLMRFDGTDWQRWGPADGVPGLGYGTGVVLKQAPDGGLWMTRDYQQATWKDNNEGSCSEHWGVARFDGSSWQRFLPGHCTGSVHVAPDGSLWVKARSGDNDIAPYGLYVITPEAVAAE